MLFYPFCNLFLSIFQIFSWCNLFHFSIFLSIFQFSCGAFLSILKFVFYPFLKFSFEAFLSILQFFFIHCPSFLLVPSFPFSNFLLASPYPICILFLFFNYFFYLSKKRYPFREVFRKKMEM